MEADTRPAAPAVPSRRPVVMGGPGDDRGLVARARGGDTGACRRLVELHWPGAWRAALAITGRAALAEDVAQDAFERAFAALGRFDETKPFAPWLHRIVVNRALDLVRAERRLVGLDEARAPEAWAPADDDADRPALEALASLSPERRAVIVLRHLLGYSPPEIAEITGLPLGTVNSRLGRALAQLRMALDGTDG